MEEPHSVNSPRTILSFSKSGRTTTASFSFVDPNDEISNSGEHGLKPSEVYGFVGSITTVVATGPNHFPLFYPYIVFLFMLLFTCVGFYVYFRFCLVVTFVNWYLFLETYQALDSFFNLIFAEQSTKLEVWC
ncbi:hypothetical protein J1N35_010323 [Gossypium stocksii]|uniref:Transmembrane protein n=1 Tax=Gossypium stocksii TaxID=47602 RepID=A0A9D3W251_9ROSI|nr:hypothetical protein J1N35_010323 [Gossypium stocksii]